MFLAFVLVLGSSGPKAFAYNLGSNSGLLDRANGFQRKAADVSIE